MVIGVVCGGLFGNTFCSEQIGLEYGLQIDREGNIYLDFYSSHHTYIIYYILIPQYFNWLQYFTYISTICKNFFFPNKPYSALTHKPCKNSYVCSMQHIYYIKPHLCLQVIFCGFSVQAVVVGLGLAYNGFVYIFPIIIT